MRPQPPVIAKLRASNIDQGNIVMKFGEAICALLARRGVDTIFGIPGVHTLELFRNIEQHGITAVTPRHEQGAGFMADGYARATGKPGVCFLVTGPGVLNALTPIAQAWHDSQPMLVIASTVEEAEVGQHRGALHDTPDLVDTLRPYTLISRRVTSIDDFHESIEEAYLLWATERARPVYLEVPLDILSTEVSLPELSTDKHNASPQPWRPSSSEVEQAAAALVKAQAPVIIAGGGCRHAGEHLEKVATRLDAPVVLTANSKGLLPAEHPLNLGLSTPFEGTRDLLEEADVVLALGTELSDVEYIFTGAESAVLRNLIRVDIDPNVCHKHQSRPTIQADASTFLSALQPKLDELGVQDRTVSGADRAAQAKASWKEAFDNDPYCAWVNALETSLPANALVAVDSAQLAYQAQQFMPLPDEMTWMAPYAFGTLGPSIPMAIGAAVAYPDRPAVAIAGDGSSLFTIAELATAADIARQLTVILWVNGGYKEIEHSFDRADIPPIGVTTSAPDFEALVQGFGGFPTVVTSPDELAAALASAVEEPRLNVILIDAPAALRIRETSK